MKVEKKMKTRRKTGNKREQERRELLEKTEKWKGKLGNEGV